MSKVWPVYTKDHPCPLCNRWDWSCRAGSFMLICMRVQSDKPCSSGGWYHHYGDYRPTFKPERKMPERKIDCYSLVGRWRRETSTSTLSTLADALGVNLGALQLLGACYAKEHHAYAFPMRNELGDIVGIRLRNNQGFKWAVSGSRQGVFTPDTSDYIPWAAINMPKMVFLPEGPTDTAALLSLGLFAIGRPNCMSGNEQIKLTMQRMSITKAVIIADNDSLKKGNIKDFRPGVNGAKKLANDLKCKHVIFILPSPCKDVRDFLALGGTRKSIENEINHKTWSQ